MDCASSIRVTPLGSEPAGATFLRERRRRACIERAVVGVWKAELPRQGRGSVVLVWEVVGHAAALDPAERRGGTRGDTDGLDVRLGIPTRAVVVVVVVDVKRLRLRRRRSRRHRPGPEALLGAGKGPHRGCEGVVGCVVARARRGGCPGVAEHTCGRLGGRLVAVASVARVRSGRRCARRLSVDVDDGVGRGETGCGARRAGRRGGDGGIVWRRSGEEIAAIGSHGRTGI
jgi:hypothetical protein